jgi:hypothetical protein
VAGWQGELRRLLVCGGPSGVVSVVVAVVSVVRAALAMTVAQWNAPAGAASAASVEAVAVRQCGDGPGEAVAGRLDRDG